MTQPSDRDNLLDKLTDKELTKASDAIAVAVRALLPQNHDPQAVTDFRVALGNLLAATLGGATRMAAGTVVAVNAKVDRLDQETNTKIDRIVEVRGQRLLDLQEQIHLISSRVHALEDEFIDTGSVPQLAVTMYALAREMERLASEVERLKALADHAGE